MSKKNPLKSKNTRLSTTDKGNKTTPKPNAAAPGTQGTKLSLVIKLLRRTGGATIGDLAKATDWQEHTVRAVLSRLRSGNYKIISIITKNGSKHVFRIIRTGGSK